MNPLAPTARAHWLARALQWRWAWMGALALVAACSAVLGPLQVGTPGSHGNAQAAVQQQPLDVPAVHTDLGALAAGNGPEGRLIAAYVALGEGQGRQAFDLVSALVRDHPEFALAQLLYADLLATRAGVPSSFGADGSSAPAEGGERRAALREEALRRLAALRERPPTGKVPAEFAQLPARIAHAVAVDTSRSRLYLFSNGPDGLKLVRDFYVSLGKQGIAKQVEGDRRTPLGVYWITSALPPTQLDERFGSAALRFNYPNAWDRLRGRTGTGLYLHGVPSSVLTHVPWATDGCVAMSNDDVRQLLKTLDVDNTPVVITKQLSWVDPHDVRQAAAEFRPAFRAWDDARRNADMQDLTLWYDPNVPVPRETVQDNRERGDVSFVAWYGDESPMMIVTARAKSGSADAAAFRQYWVHREGQWRIVFDGPVSISDSLPARAQALAAARPAEKKPRRPGHRRTASRSAGPSRT